jgi:hypothetical protein
LVHGGLWILSLIPQKRRSFMEQSMAKVRNREEQGIGIGSASFEKDVLKLPLMAGGVMAAMVGLWGLTCLAAGLIQAGGPLSLMGAWFSAVMGG